MKTTSCSITRFTRHMCAPPLRRPCRLAYRQLIISRLSFSICYLRLAIAWQLFAICSLRFAVGHPAASAHSTSQTPSVQRFSKIFKGIQRYSKINLNTPVLICVYPCPSLVQAPAAIGSLFRVSSRAPIRPLSTFNEY